MPASPPPHASLVRAAAAEDQRVGRALERLERRRESLRAELADLEAQMGSLRERQRLLGMLVDDVATADDEASVPARGSGVRPVRGRRLRLIAAQLLWQSLAEQEIHYREWFERLLQAGYAVGGRDPLASFLTNVRDSPAVVRGQRQGFYRLDRGRQDVVAVELAEAQAEMVDLEQSLQRARSHNDTAAVERLRVHRDKLAGAIKRLEARRDELAAVFTEARDRDQHDTPSRVQAA
jgi:hypothetical protein